MEKSGLPLHDGEGGFPDGEGGFPGIVGGIPYEGWSVREAILFKDLTAGVSDLLPGGRTV